MSKKIITLAIAALALTAPIATIAQNPFNNGMPGIAIAGTTGADNLPQEAKNFIHKHFKDVAIRAVEKEFDENTYEVNMANGVEMEFSGAGQILSIDAPDYGKSLPIRVVKDILPHKAYEELKKIRQEANVDEIEFKGGHIYEIGTREIHANDYSFDITRNIWTVDPD